MISAVVYGTLVVALVQGTLGGLMFWWLGLPAPLLWAAVMALVAVLPIFGAALVWLPAAAFLLIDGHWEKALILAAVGLGRDRSHRQLPLSAAHEEQAVDAHRAGLHRGHGRPVRVRRDRHRARAR